MSKRSKLRVRYYKETLNHWKLPNSTMQPTVEYTIWLEKLVILNDFSERQQPTEANDNPDTKQLIIGDVRRSALEWWNQLKGNRQGVMTKHRGIIYNAKTRQPMELTGSEIEMLFKIEGHYA